MHCTESQLYECFAKFGGIEEARIMKDTYKKKSRGFGFVIFTNQESVKLALKDDVYIDGKWVEVKESILKYEIQ